MKKILVMGLPGAGKTTLATLLAARLNAVHFNADAVRKHINKDLGFAEADRIEHASRMGWLCDQVVKTGGFAVADFICPTPETRTSFVGDEPTMVVWVDRIDTGRFEDTNKMFVPPEKYDVRVVGDDAPELWAERICALAQPVFDPKKPTALFIGRYQPFHAGHRALVLEGLRRVGQVCIAVRDTEGTDARNPFKFEYVASRIDSALHAYAGRYRVIKLPNVTNVFYGRDVGYAVERIELDKETEAVSATNARKLVGV